MLLQLQHRILLFLPLLSCVASHPTKDTIDSLASLLGSNDGKQNFQNALKDLSKEAGEDLHSALHEHLYPKFSHDVSDWVGEAPKDAQAAVEKKLALAKRQSGESSIATSAVVPPPQDASSHVVQSTQAPPPAETTPSPSAADQQSSSAPPSSPASSIPAPESSPEPISTPAPSTTPPPASSAPPPRTDPTIAVPVTRTNSAGTTYTSTVLQPAGILSSTDANGSVQIITTPKPTTPVVATRTNDQGSTFLTTITPSGSVVTNLVTRTTTGPGGVVETVVQTEVVEITEASPDATGVPAGEGEGGSEPSESAGLQTGAAAVAMHGRGGGMEKVAVVLGGVVLLW